MATLVNGSAWGEWATSGNTKYLYLSGTVSRSGNTVTLSGLTYYFTTKWSSYASGYTMNTTIKTTNGGSTLSSTNCKFTFNGTTSNTVSLNNASVSVGSADTSYTFRIYDDANSYVSFTVSFSAAYTKPTKPTISVTRGAGQNVITYGTTSFGTGTGNNHVYLYGGTGSTPTTQIASKTTTGNSTYTHSGLSAGTTYYYRALASNGGLNSDYSSTVSAKTYTAPSTPSCTISSYNYNSITISYGTSSYGDPSTGTTYLYGGTSASPTTQRTSKTPTGNSTYTWSNLSSNTKYYIRARASNGKLNSSYSTERTVVTACPTPTTLTKGTETYTAYNKLSTVFNWGRSSDGNANARTGCYRISTDGGSSYGSWTSIGTIGNSTTSGTFTVTNIPTNSSIAIQFSINNGVGSGAKTLTYTSATTHTAPNFSNYTYRDSNATTSTLTGNDQTMIQGQSTPEITISTSNKATGNQGIAVTNYSFSFSGRTDTANWSSNSNVVKTLGTPQNSGSQTMSVSAVDALSLSKAITKSVTVYPWAKPTISASISRTNNFEAESTLKISGTWAPITISGTDKNTIQVDYRCKQSSSSSWGNWTNRPATTSGGNWTTVDLVDTFDNTQQWDFEIRAIDQFTTVTVSLTLSVGIPIFFIGSDGRVSIGSKPGKSLLTGEKGLLEVDGRIICKASVPSGYGSISLENDEPLTDTFFKATRTDTNASICMGIGMGGTRHGIWSDSLNNYMIYSDLGDSHVYVNGAPISIDYLMKYMPFTSYRATNITTANINLNSATYCKVGKYVCTNGSTGASQSNNPSGTAYQMWVININSDVLDVTDGAWRYFGRLMLAINGLWWQNLNTNASGTISYGAWKQLHN